MFFKTEDNQGQWLNITKDDLWQYLTFTSWGLFTSARVTSWGRLPWKCKKNIISKHFENMFCFCYHHVHYTLYIVHHTPWNTRANIICLLSLEWILIFIWWIELSNQMNSFYVRVNQILTTHRAYSLLPLHGGHSKEP